MSVYTAIDSDELEDFLSGYPVGRLRDFEGINAGIENTNYFVNTSDAVNGRFVLTLFERHTLEEMQYFLRLMHHLAQHRVPGADPVADNDGNYVRLFKQKPAALVHRLDGSSITTVSITHCEQIGAALGRMHSAGLDYAAHRENPRGLAWCIATAKAVSGKLADAERGFLDAEIRYLREHRDADIPRGVIHADLFRDNTLWQDGSLSGIIDFYDACNDVLLYDVAVLVNDWCSRSDASLDRERVTTLLGAYHDHRPLRSDERQYWPAMLRAAALRFWLSRLYDLQFPRPGELVQTKNPAEYAAILKDRVANGATYRDYWI